MAILLIVTFAGGMACREAIDAGKVLPTVSKADAAADVVTDREQMLEALCVSTGGHVEMRACCGTSDFPAICASQSSCCPTTVPEPQMVNRRVCVCPRFHCFTPDPLPGGLLGCYGEVMSSPRPDATSGD